MELEGPQPSLKPQPPNPHRTTQSRILTTYNCLLTSMSPSLPSVVKTLTTHTPPRTLARLLLSIILSHILRILFPTLLFFWPHALSDMKLARSSPHHYLSSCATSFAWPSFILWNLFSLGVKKAREMAWEGMRRDREGDGWCVLYLMLGILRLEGAFVRTCWCGAQLWAYCKLFQGGEAEHMFLESFLQQHSWRIMAQLGLVVEWLIHGMYPAARDVVRERRWVAGVTYVCLVWGTAYAVRYSNKYFVFLEMTDVWAMGVKLTLAMGIVGLDISRRRQTKTAVKQ